MWSVEGEMSSVLIVNLYYPPDTAATGRHAATVARTLAGAGFEVSVNAGQPSYGEDAARTASSEVVEGVTVTRLPTGRGGRASLTRRLSTYVRYLLAVAWRLRRIDSNVVVSFHVPPLLGAVAAAATRLNRVPLIYIPQDIHPDIVLRSGWKIPLPIAAVWRRLERFALESAAAVVALGDGMRQTLIEKGADPERVRVIPLWAEPVLCPLPIDRNWRREHMIEADLILTYAGNIGVMHPLEPLLEALAARDDGRVAVVLAGDGVRKAHWEQVVAQRGLRNVHFLPYQHQDAFARLIAASDIGIVALADGMERLAVPARTYALLSAGKPILAMTSSRAEAGRLCIERGVGWHAPTAEAIVSVIDEALADSAALGEIRERAVAAFHGSFAPEKVARAYVELVAGVVSARRR